MSAREEEIRSPRIPSGREAEAEDALDAVEDALALVCATLPHLSGLSYAVRYTADYRLPTAGIFASGRLLVNPEWFLKLSRRDAGFVIAHELMHLALRSHERHDRRDAALFNIAHDCIINDMLVEALGRSEEAEPVPAGGWYYPEARFLSAEELMTRARKGEVGRCRGGRCTPALSGQPSSSPLAAALQEAGLGTDSSLELPTPGAPGATDDDVLSEAQEREWYPEINDKRRAELRREMMRQAATVASLEQLQKALERQRLIHSPGQGLDPGGQTALVQALKSLYAPPWEMALQSWMEAVSPGPRTFNRANRRGGAERTDVALPGRSREGWILHLVLDTSGSMVSEFARILGVIGAFCEGVGVDLVRVLQCDAEVTHDEYVDPLALKEFALSGMGGSDMSPALDWLARDPEVEAVIVLTDGYIYYPQQSPPFHVLWALTGENDRFQPGYGKVLPIPRP